jgi:hypothetical protein
VAAQAFTWLFIVAHAFFTGYSAHVARQLGFKYWHGLLLGLLLGPIALIVLMIMQPPASADEPPRDNGAGGPPTR